MSELNDKLSDAELEQLIISVIKTENETLSKRFFGNLKKEIAAMKDELLKELKKQLVEVIEDSRRSDEAMARFPEVYKNQQWPISRQAVIIRATGLCEKCHGKGIIKPGKEVDHIIELTDENKHDWNIAFNPDNLQYLCSDCHNHKHKRSNGLQDFVEPVK